MSRQPIDDLIDKPLNELTEEEAQIVIEWKAAQQFNEYKFSEQARILQEQTSQIAASYEQLAESSKETLTELRGRALAFYQAQ